MQPVLALTIPRLIVRKVLCVSDSKGSLMCAFMQAVMVACLHIGIELQLQLWHVDCPQRLHNGLLCCTENGKIKCV